MNKLIIACETLRDELNLAIQETGCHYPIIWVSADYHIDPEKLRAKLQQEIDALSDVDRILLAYGCCGNGLVGLRASTGELIIPRTDDCISMILSRPGQKYERHKQTYFLTKGWLEGSKSIAVEHAHIVKRYGAARAQKLFARMFEHYRYLMLIDTGAYSVQDYFGRVEELGRDLSLEPIIEKGDLWLLKKLLLGPYDQEFCLIPKAGIVTLQHFGYALSGPAHQIL